MILTESKERKGVKLCKWDKAQACVLVISAFVLLLLTALGVVTVLPSLTTTVNSWFDGNHWIASYSVFLFGWGVSLFLKLLSDRFQFEQWKYVFLLAFSLLGSVLVSALTVNTFSPYLMAAALTLAHLSWWSWRKEFNESKTFNTKLSDTVNSLEGSLSTLDNKILEATSSLSQIDTTVNTLDQVINNMPNESAFKAASEIYGVTFKVATDLKNSLPILSKSVKNLGSDRKKTKEALEKSDSEARDAINSTLESFCAIAEAWTQTTASFFEANIMLVEKSTDLDKSSAHNQEAFERGSCFFPSNASLENLSSICESVLSVFTDVGYFDESRRGSKKLKPLLLPVGVFAKYDAISVPGAPSAFESKNVVLINNVADIANTFKSYGDIQKNSISAYFDSQKGCGSVISLPIPMTWSHGGYFGVVNVYRPESGGVKNEHLFYQLCTPILYLLSDLLSYKLRLSSLSKDLEVFVDE
ncbi:hypothetical protein [Shewanella nanhaiensis]|uniref:Methyl-accepting chemotaxis protein n=1 Tax=Shewanella nanhaiensis TaxID=2864872 RepID=A0ABS7E2Y3_9GAMM|nr:hypothetical protein [Shewanella nanhaiensis]MBW8184061.1 hypothetical protein [Shewanella nanhaiensis]